MENWFEVGKIVGTILIISYIYGITTKDFRYALCEIFDGSVYGDLLKEIEKYVKQKEVTYKNNVELFFSLVFIGIITIPLLTSLYFIGFFLSYIFIIITIVVLSLYFKIKKK